MALLVPGGGCARLAISHPAQVSRRTAVVATLSPPKLDKVDYWVDATSSFFEPDSRPIMLYDGVCNLCNGGVKFVRDNDKNRRIRYEALQSESGKKLLRRSGRAPDDISSVVLVEKDRSHIKSDAVLKIMEYIDLPFPQLAFFLQFVPQFVRDFAYDNIANNRYNIFGRSDSSSSCTYNGVITSLRECYLWDPHIEMELPFDNFNILNPGSFVEFSWSKDYIPLGWKFVRTRIV